VSNVGLLHPALVLRQFAQLAVLVGGQRVLAGLGAGWNRETVNRFFDQVLARR
jgi:alkanesulfonate monooxygenase SsuD/methylene tetrahydromethanopterin reductase-like flavin-dependent oxidoreductase (luciferase family)